MKPYVGRVKVCVTLGMLLAMALAESSAAQNPQYAYPGVAPLSPYLT